MDTTEGSAAWAISETLRPVEQPHSGQVQAAAEAVLTAAPDSRATLRAAQSVRFQRMGRRGRGTRERLWGWDSIGNDSFR